MKVTLSYSELRKLFAPVIPHAGTDDMLPVLTRIAVATSGAYLVAQATDRFTAAFQRVQPKVAPPAGFGLLIAAADAKRMIHLLRPIRGSDPAVVIEIDKHGGVHVSSESPGLALGFSGIDVTFSSPVLGENSFPDMASLIPATTDESVAEISFSLTLLTRFKAGVEGANQVSGHRDHRLACQIHMPDRMNKPLILTAGPDFIGVVMPRRHDGESVPALLATWRDQIPRNGVRPPNGESAPVVPAPSTAEEVAAAAGLSTHTDAEIDAAAGGQR